MKEDQEFWAAFIIWGGLAFAVSITGISIFFLGLAVKGKLKKKTIIKELYEDKKNRSNGHAPKGGARGHY